MMVLITYDVDTISEDGNKRLRKVAKVCRDYGVRVQNSVFECKLTDAQFLILKNKIKNIINEEVDNIRIYVLGNKSNHKIEVIGKQRAIDFDGELII